jgi:hypothetical protein
MGQRILYPIDPKGLLTVDYTQSLTEKYGVTKPYDEEESSCDWQRHGWAQVFRVHDC